jgi:signal peptide peptidase SppA
MRRSFILEAFMSTPWAILPEKLTVLEEVVMRHLSGEKLSADEIEARVHGAQRPPEQMVQSVAVLPLFGTIFPRANLMTDVSGATSAESFGARFNQLMADPNIDAIVLDVDSPGGQASGVLELSKAIFDARGSKPVVAVANHLMASAAYWIASAADEIVVTPSAQVGSIGVFSVHQDMSAAMEKDGVKTTLISAGKYKTEGNQFEPLTDEARAAIQDSVDEVYDRFVGAVAGNRAKTTDQVKSDFGQGRLVRANQAVRMGMADRVGTLDDVIQGLLRSAKSNSSNLSSRTESSSESERAKIEREAQSLRTLVLKSL